MKASGTGGEIGFGFRSQRPCRIVSGIAHWPGQCVSQCPLTCPACSAASNIINILTLFDAKDESLLDFRYIQNLWQKRANMTVICARVAVPVGFSVVGVVPEMMPFA